MSKPNLKRGITIELSQWEADLISRMLQHEYDEVRKKKVGEGLADLKASEKAAWLMEIHGLMNKIAEARRKQVK